MELSYHSCFHILPTLLSTFFRGFIVNVLSGRSTVFHSRAKNFSTELRYKKNIPPDVHGQTSWAKLSSHPVNLPSGHTFMKLLKLFDNDIL